MIDLDDCDLVRETNAHQPPAAALYSAIPHDGQYVAVKIDPDGNWTVTKPRAQAALLAALETEAA